MTPPVPAEILAEARLAAVRRTGLLDTPPDAWLDQLAELAAALLQTPFAFVTLVDERRSFWKAAVGVPADAPRGSDVEASFCRYVIQQPGTLLVDDTREDPRTRENPSIEGMGVLAWAGATVVGPGGEALGSFCVVDRRPRRWTERDEEVLRILAAAASAQITHNRADAAADAQHAAREAAATEVRRQLGVERDVTHLLQETLLPSTLAEIPGASVAARYRAADERASVGGDFYDLFVAGDRSYVTVVGDVCGKGAKAAAATSMARWSLRSHAVRTSDPAELLTHLRDVVAQEPAAFAPHEFITAAAVRLQAGPEGTLQVTAAHAGHPPSIVCGPDRAPTILARRGPLIAAGTTKPFPAETVELRPGEVLLLYTDGLLDSQAPERQLEAGDLVPIIRAAAGDVHTLSDTLMATAEGPRPIRDDIALVAIAAKAG